MGNLLLLIAYRAFTILDNLLSITESLSRLFQLFHWMFLGSFGSFLFAILKKYPSKCVFLVSPIVTHGNVSIYFISPKSHLLMDSLLAASSLKIIQP